MFLLPPASSLPAASLQWLPYRRPGDTALLLPPPSLPVLLLTAWESTVTDTEGEARQPGGQAALVPGRSGGVKSPHPLSDTTLMKAGQGS